jgi:uroporphyrinogen-III synthase
MRVVVTRPAAQAADWVAQLQALGVDAVALPLIAIAPLDDTAPVAAAWRQLAGTALVMFVSANAVEHFFAARPPGLPWPEGVRAGSTGPGTTAALRAQGLAAAQIVAPAADAPTFDSEALWALLADEDWAQRRVLVVRGEDGRDWFAETLRGRGATLGFVAAYRRLPPQPDASALRLLAAALAAPAVHLWLFSSSEALLQLRRLAPGADWSAAQAVASHPRIAESARRAGFGRVDDVPPSPHAVAALVRASSWGLPVAPSIQSPPQ